MPTSFKTGGRTPAGCAEARKLRANGDRNNTIAKARSMISLASFDLCSLGTNISLFFSFPSMLLGLNLLALLRPSRLRLRRLRSRLLGRLRNRLPSRLLNTNHPPRVRIGVED